MQSIKEGLDLRVRDWHWGMWEKLTTFLKEVQVEFSRVNWPTREELINSTSVVLVFSVAFAIFIGIFDLIISFVWKIFLGR